MVKNIWQKTMFLRPDAATNFWEMHHSRFFKSIFNLENSFLFLLLKNPSYYGWLPYFLCPFILDLEEGEEESLFIVLSQLLLEGSKKWDIFGRLL